MFSVWTQHFFQVPMNTNTHYVNYNNYVNYIIIMEIKWINRTEGKVPISSTFWLQLLLNPAYLVIHQEIIKQSLIFHAVFKSVHRRHETHKFYTFINFMLPSWQDQYWTKLCPSVALVLLYNDLLLLGFFTKSAVRISLHFPFNALRQTLGMKSSSDIFWQCLHFPQVHLNYLHHLLPLDLLPAFCTYCCR